MFKLYKNILSKKEQNILLKFIKSSVKFLGEGYPGLQTSPDLHLYDEMKPFIKATEKYHKNYSIERCWANYTNGNYIYWHNHSQYSLSIVYYLKNPSSVGVMFKDPSNTSYDLITYTDGPENSLVIFDSNKVHSVPNDYKQKDRYSIALDLTNGKIS
tara:strand:- start:511 stop:981 length:471 start_codon:yes stop_codon:yes gene_type:complete